MDDLEIDRALRATLSGEPSPDFVARVRTTLDAGPRPSIVAGWLRPAVAVACAAVVMMAVGLPRKKDVAPATAGLKPSATHVSQSTRTAEMPAGPALAAPTFSPDKTNKSPSRARAIAFDPPLPEVVVAAGDVEALRQLLLGLNEQTFVASFDETPASTPWVMTNLSVAPLGGDPLDSPPAHNN